MQFGYTGLLNFGQIAFAMLGAFGIAISVTKWGLPFWVGVVIGLVAAVVLALLLGLPDPAPAGGLPGDRHHRRRGGLAAAVPVGVGSTPVTGGTRGLAAFNRGLRRSWPRGRPASGTTSSARRWSGVELWVALVGWSLVALFCLLVWALVRARGAGCVRSIREDEDAVRALGKNVYVYKMQALVLGGVIGALGGMVYAVGTGSAIPDQYQNANTFLAYAALILGGAATGARSGGRLDAAAVHHPVRRHPPADADQQRDHPGGLLSATDVAQIRFVLVGLGLILLMVFRPQGIFGDRREVMLDAR